ncbi:hypothetical protein ACFQU2_41845 [Siccirubricoccus deserti]
MTRAVTPLLVSAAGVLMGSSVGLVPRLEARSFGAAAVAFLAAG